MKILFVCSSNVCRSPYCEFHMKKFIESEPKLQNIVKKVDSAAVFNISFKLFYRAKACLLNEGFTKEELSVHKPKFKLFYPKLFTEADVIIGMTKSHKLMLNKKYRDKFITLSKAATGTYIPIPDPFARTTQKKYDEDMRVLYGYLEQYKNNLIRDNI